MEEISVYSCNGEEISVYNCYNIVVNMNYSVSLLLHAIKC